MDGKKANLIVTDPPYNVAFKSGSGLSIQNDSMENGEFYTFLYNSFQNMAGHLEKGGAAYVFQHLLCRTAMDDGRLQFYGR